MKDKIEIILKDWNRRTETMESIIEDSLEDCNYQLAAKYKDKLQDLKDYIETLAQVLKDEKSEQLTKSADSHN